MSSDRGDGFCLCHPDNFPSHITTQPPGISAGPVSVIPLFACHYPLDRCLQQVLCGRHQSWSLNVASDSASTPWLVLGRGAPWAIPFTSVIPRWLTSGMSWHSSVGDFLGSGRVLHNPLPCPATWVVQSKSWRHSWVVQVRPQAATWGPRGELNMGPPW